MVTSKTKEDKKELETKAEDESKGLIQFSLFRKLSNFVFDEIDVDKSGTVDEQELYTGLLLFHVYLASYLGPSAAKPASRRKVEQVFRLMDKDRNGTLDRYEFARAMEILSSDLITKVAVLLCFSMIIAPVITQRILGHANGIAAVFMAQSIYYVGCDCNDLGSCVDTYLGGYGYMQTIVWLVVETFIVKYIYKLFGLNKALPYLITKLLFSYRTVVPIGAITAAPKTIISLSLGYIIIPQLFNLLDRKIDYFAKVVSEQEFKAFGIKGHSISNFQINDDDDDDSKKDN